MAVQDCDIYLTVLGLGVLIVLFVKFIFASESVLNRALQY